MLIVKKGQSMTTGEYISEKISTFQRNHCYTGYLTCRDSDIQRMWQTEKNRENEKWRAIKNNDDVLKLIDAFESTVSYVEKYVKLGNIEDGYRMALALYNAIQGLHKLAKNIDPHPWNKTEFMPMTTQEVDAIFDRLEAIAARMSEQNARRAMQD